MAAAALEVFDVLEGGLQSTIQDGGRPGHEPDGVPRSGAADSIGLAVANLLLGNPPDAAGIEVTLIGLRLRALADVDVALGGADLGARVEASNGAAAEEDVAPGHALRLRAGQVLRFEGRADDQASGCRAYLAVPGGVAVPAILDSRSTCLPAGFGGLDGRALRAGDRLLAGADGGRASQRRAAGALPAQLSARLPSPAQRLRVLPGPQFDQADAAFLALVDRPWLVSPTSDRRGLRLEPAAPSGANGTGLIPAGIGELPSLGVLPGAIQLTPSGQPLVLGPDAGTTGGYPVVAVVIEADLPLLGQLAPGAEARFRATTLDAARDAALERRRFLADLASHLS